MNKYLRTWMLGSPIPWLRNIATRSVRKTHAKRHAAHQSRIFSLLYQPGETPKVLNGPFAGMLYLNEPVWGSITPRWIGSYESCLWPAVNDIITRGYARIIDVGCAEGYYAAGLCRALPGTEVFAYDLDPDSQAQVRKLWQLNGSPGRLNVRGLLNHEELERLASPGDLLICDIEGGEMQLLDPSGCPTLNSLDILVEVHQTGVTSPEANAAILKQRFAATHDIRQFDESSRATDFDHVSPLDADTLKKAISEGRPYPQVWLWMKSLRTAA
jgi:hypothetical protein